MFIAIASLLTIAGVSGKHFWDKESKKAELRAKAKAKGEPVYQYDWNEWFMTDSNIPVRRAEMYNGHICYIGKYNKHVYLDITIHRVRYTQTILGQKFGCVWFSEAKRDYLVNLDTMTRCTTLFDPEEKKYYLAELLTFDPPAWTSRIEPEDEFIVKKTEIDYTDELNLSMLLHPTIGQIRWGDVKEEKDYYIK